MMKVTRIDVQVLGDRHYPLASGRIPEEQAREFSEVLADAQELNPAATAEDVIRAIWRMGMNKVANNTAQKIRVKTAAPILTPTAPILTTVEPTPPPAAPEPVDEQPGQ